MSDRTPQSHDAGSGGGTPSDGTASQFVSWQHDEASIRKARARLYHKKSRNGCQQCRARHVKVGLPRFFPVVLLVCCQSYQDPTGRLMPLRLRTILFMSTYSFRNTVYEVTFYGLSIFPMVVQFLL